MLCSKRGMPSESSVKCVQVWSSARPQVQHDCLPMRIPFWHRVFSDDVSSRPREQHSEERFKTLFMRIFRLGVGLQYWSVHHECRSSSRSTFVGHLPPNKTTATLLTTPDYYLHERAQGASRAATVIQNTNSNCAVHRQRTREGAGAGARAGAVLEVAAEAAAEAENAWILAQQSPTGRLEVERKRSSPGPGGADPSRGRSNPL